MIKNLRSFFPKSKTLGDERKSSLLNFTKRLSIRFRNLILLDTAFRHSSCGKDNNERLEFLGDTVLDLAAAAYLYSTMPDAEEGALSKIKSQVVSEQALSKIALSIGIDECMVLGKGEESSGGRAKKALLADALEAVIGAYYLDCGFDSAYKFVISLIGDELQNIREDKHSYKDYKTLLQEYCQKKYHQCPVYELTKKSGPEHDKTFWVRVLVAGAEKALGSGKNKKEAEQNAARSGYEQLTDLGEAPEPTSRENRRNNGNNRRNRTK
ncbi:MAG: ribonuclease III [Treponemataceae bacterium]|nr:MAG: ribonuclease III [Treponemataceae bacterium]